MKIFCVGIGGIGLSGVSQILKSQGNKVSGSDSSPSEITQRLQAAGIHFFEKHSFYPTENKVKLFKTLKGIYLGEITSEEKGEISHRGKALEKLMNDTEVLNKLKK